MALAWLHLAVWLSTLVVFAQSQPPGARRLLHPSIYLKLTKDRQIITSTRGSQQWNGLYTTDSLSPSSTEDIESAAASLTVVDVNGFALPPYDTVYTFNQLINHNDTKAGTFVQRYFFTYEFFEPGGPIFLHVPSESALENYDGSITNSTLTGYLAQQNRGAALVLEHRFFGQSNPYPNLTESSFAVHTIEQAIADIVYFAQNVKLPMPTGSKAGPNNLPWVLVGGSYPGALVAWTISQHPGLFAAGWASSAVVQSQSYFWSYFDVIQQFMPRNCSADLQAVATHIDQVFTSGSAADQAALKAAFGMSTVLYADDVAAAIRTPIVSWQDLQPFYQDANAGFYAFCNYLEYDRVNKQYESSGNGVGLTTALSAYGNWTLYETRVLGCTGSEELCFGTHTVNSSVTWTNTTVDNSLRSWAWLYCNQLGWFYSGAPSGWPSLTSRLNTPDTEVRLCSLYFPERFPMGTLAAVAQNETAFNAKYGGWNIRTTNVFFANGKKDVWRGVTLSSDLYNHVSTPSQPIAVADGGFHCSDLVMQAGQSEPTVGAVQNLGAAYIYSWLTTWYTAHTNVTRPINATVMPDPSTLPIPSFTAEAIPQSIVNGTWVTTAASVSAAAVGSTTSTLGMTNSGTASAATGTENSDNNGGPSTQTQTKANAGPRSRHSGQNTAVLCLVGGFFLAYQWAF